MSIKTTILCRLYLLEITEYNEEQITISPSIKFSKKYLDMAHRKMTSRRYPLSVQTPLGIRSQSGILGQEGGRKGGREIGREGGREIGREERRKMGRREIE